MRKGEARRGLVRPGMVWQVWSGGGRYGLAWSGSVGFGKVRQVRLGEGGMERSGGVRLDMVWQL